MVPTHQITIIAGTLLSSLLPFRSPYLIKIRNAMKIGYIHTGEKKKKSYTNTNEKHQSSYLIGKKAEKPWLS